MELPDHDQTYRPLSVDWLRVAVLTGLVVSQVALWSIVVSFIYRSLT